MEHGTYFSTFYERTTAERDRLIRREKAFSLLRLLSFFAILLAVYFIVRSGWSAAWTSIPAITAFITVILLHERLRNRITYMNSRLKVLSGQLSALKYDFSAFHPGSEFTDNGHPYTTDLDVFGQDSLFQCLNASPSPLVQRTFARRLREPFHTPEPIERMQQAVKELSENVDTLVESLTLAGISAEQPEDMEMLERWVQSPPLFRRSLWKWLVMLVPLIGFGLLALIIAGIITPGWFLIWLFIPLGIVGKHFKAINERYGLLSRRHKLLNCFLQRFALLEDGKFNAPLLQEWQRETAENGSAVHTIRALTRIMSAFDYRLNMLMGAVLNILFLWDIKQLRKLEAWQQHHKDDLMQFFNRLGEFETAGSLALFAFRNPAFCYPKIIGSPLRLEAMNAGHPLIPPQRRVDNPIRIEKPGFFNVVTGANMAGKSTYLRTIGANWLLASIGAPVCAEAFRFYPAPLHTSLRTSDSLAANKSYFFAELERLKSIIDRLEAGEELYILLDEILKGTNSYDKQSGSRALLKQLIRYKAAVVIATHDLDLGRLAEEFPENVVNYRFEAQIDDNSLTFDYRLKPGIAENMNATFLMKQMGITL